jgi:GDP/UDP-N,N'-diacetylbacillosamine 2-epimerase (hydrolysing)
MKRKVCVVTGSRAEYGLLKWLLQDIQASADLELQLIVTGAHLAPDFGLTYQEIELDGFRIDRKLESLLSSDTAVGAAKSIGLGVIAFADAFAELSPDILVVLGDRYELLAPVSAALVTKIPVAHIHGGEVTTGAIDDAVRHAVTKLSHLHFVATEEYRRRIIQLGEHPDRVQVVGGLGVDAVSRIRLLDREALSKAIGFEFGNRNLLVTFHPETLSEKSPEAQVNELLKALNGFPGVNLVITYPNADVGGQAIAELLEDYAMNRPGTKVFRSLGQLNYYSCLQFVDGVIGNSSSGLLEVPSFNKGTINIGQRQSGRPRAASVIDCEADEGAIFDALEQFFSDEFRSMLPDVENPYGNGGASREIVATLENIDFGMLPHKPFYDIIGVLGGGQ